MLRLTPRVRHCIGCFFGRGFCRLFPRLLRGNFLFAESHSAHQIRIRARRFVPLLRTRLRRYLTLRLRPVSVGCFSLCLGGGKGSAIGPGLRFRLGSSARASDSCFRSK